VLKLPPLTNAENGARSIDRNDSCSDTIA